MISDRWEIAHLGIAVADLEGAMALYETALGASWWEGIHTAPIDHLTTEPPGFRTDGLRVALSVPPPHAVSRAPVMLLHAAPGSPSFDFYGCRNGLHELHHIAYSVDDPEREIAHLERSGFETRVVMRDADGDPWYSYLRAPASAFHIELIGRRETPS